MLSSTHPPLLVSIRSSSKLLLLSHLLHRQPLDIEKMALFSTFSPAAQLVPSRACLHDIYSAVSQSSFIASCLVVSRHRVATLTCSAIATSSVPPLMTVVIPQWPGCLCALERCIAVCRYPPQKRRITVPSLRQTVTVSRLAGRSRQLEDCLRCCQPFTCD